MYHHFVPVDLSPIFSSLPQKQQDFFALCLLIDVIDCFPHTIEKCTQDFHVKKDFTDSCAYKMYSAHRMRRGRIIEVIAFLQKYQSDDLCISIKDLNISADWAKDAQSVKKLDEITGDCVKYTEENSEFLSEILCLLWKENTEVLQKLCSNKPLFPIDFTKYKSDPNQISVPLDKLSDKDIVKLSIDEGYLEKKEEALKDLLFNQYEQLREELQTTCVKKLVYKVMSLLLALNWRYKKFSLMF